ncbi:MAG: thiamine-phosphate kinase, partial [Thiotrichales bacterium]|nr:thiamine-phosphate kinase [Thiotrichales bacterium]
MALSEFEIIRQFFDSKSQPDPDVVHGIGDDAATLRVPTGQELLISVDTLVENVHFHAGIAPVDLGYRALAVNLSDMAA